MASGNHEKLKELQHLFHFDAWKHDVFTIDSAKVPRIDVARRPSLTLGHDTFKRDRNMKRTPEGTAPDFKNK